MKGIASSNEEFLQLLIKKGDPVKYFEAKAKSFSLEATTAEKARLLDGVNRYQESKIKLDNPEFLNKPVVKELIAVKDEKKLRSEIAVELTRQELLTKYPAKDLSITHKSGSIELIGK